MKKKYQLYNKLTLRTYELTDLTATTNVLTLRTNWLYNTVPY